MRTGTGWEISYLDISVKTKKEIYGLVRMEPAYIYMIGQKNKFKGYTTENSLILSNYCYEIQDSQQGYLIISGDKGLSFFDPEQELFKVVELGTAASSVGNQ